MSYTLDYGHENVEDPDRPSFIDTPDDLDEDFWRIGVMHSNAGLHVLAHLGPTGEPPVLRFGFAVNGDDAGRAVLQWLPTDEFAYTPTTPPPDRAVSFDGELLDALERIVSYPPAHTRLTPAQLQDAIRDYVRTGQRPTSVHWSTP